MTAPHRPSLREALAALVKSMDGVASIGYNPERYEALEQARAALATPPQPAPLTAEQRIDLESAIRFREHNEEEKGHKSWWRCIPVADIPFYQKLQPIWGTPQPAPLDVERLARALNAAMARPFGWPPDQVAAIAAAYAALDGGTGVGE